ncbi:MAG TPA: type II toxin-antitoxin system HipA family toxin [Verrucomicrobiae bacterium]|jgi:serine/threonine-protein kinase HipA
MERTLDVYLHHDLTGTLIQNEHGDMLFSYAESWLNSANAKPLSHSLPLRKERFSRNECQGFFGGILPEEGKREIIAKNLGISARNDFAMLEQIGGECAGAVAFMPSGQPLAERNYHYRPLTDQELVNIFRELPRRPLMAGEDGIRLSLAGAQDKIAVQIVDGKISVPLGGAPSTHILKPAIARFEGLVFNEALCMRLAHAIGLRAAKIVVRKVEDIDYLQVERYDRTMMPRFRGGPEYLKREHQEDFCQALGIPSENKYQHEGGPTIKQCFDLVREICTSPVIDLQVLLDAVIYNFLIGNHDAHGKNFSILYTGETLPGQATGLAPLYDVLSTVYYPELSRKMAMKIGGEYVAQDVWPRNFEKLADEAGLAKPMVKRRVSELAHRVLENLPQIADENPVSVAVAKLIQNNCEYQLARFKEST